MIIRFVLGFALLATPLVSAVFDRREEPFVFCQKKWTEVKVHGMRLQLMHLRAESFPQGETFKLLIRNFDGSETEMFKYVANKKGHLILELEDDAVKAPPFVVTPLRLGERVTYGMVSASRNQEYADSVILFPIEVKKRGAVVSLELLDLRGESFVCRGEGFYAKEQLQVTCRSEEKVWEYRLETMRDGSFAVEIHPAAPGLDSGTATILVKRQKDQIELPFSWGKEANEFVGACCLEIR